MTLYLDNDTLWIAFHNTHDVWLIRTAIGALAKVIVMSRFDISANVTRCFTYLRAVFGKLCKRHSLRHTNQASNQAFRECNTFHSPTRWIWETVQTWQLKTDQPSFQRHTTWLIVRCVFADGMHFGRVASPLMEAKRRAPTTSSMPTLLYILPGSRWIWDALNHYLLDQWWSSNCNLILWLV